MGWLKHGTSWIKAKFFGINDKEAGPVYTCLVVINIIFADALAP